MRPRVCARRLSSPSANNSYLVIKKDATVSNDNRCGYIKLDLSTATVAPQTATLLMTAAMNSNGPMIVKCYSVADTSWTEGTITANNAPGLNLSNFSSTGTYQTQQPITYEGGAIAFDVKDFIAAHLGQVVTLQLIAEDISSSGTFFRSKEASVGKPQLILTLSSLNNDVPLPAWAEGAIAFDSAGSDGQGPSSADGVVLASGVYENNPDPDIVVRNPYGPAVTYMRRYRSAQAAKNYASPGLSVGWMDNYDLKTMGTTGGWSDPLVLTYPNGAIEVLTPQLTDGLPTTPTVFSVPSGSPYLVSGIPSSIAGQWSQINLTQKDHSTLTFAQSSDPNVLYLDQITDIMSNFVTINRDAGNRPATIVGTANAHFSSLPPSITLLTFSYQGATTTLTDAYGRTVTLSFDGNTGLLTGVSQIGSTALRWQYGYASYYNQPYLSSVGAPDPNGSGSILSNTIAYDANLRVSSLPDRNGNQRIYSYGGSTGVQVQDSAHNTALSWMQLFSATNLDAGVQDAGTHSSAIQYDLTANLYQPTVIQNELGQKVTIGYDQSGPVPCGNVGSVTVPVNGGQVPTNYFYDYSTQTGFGLGNLREIATSGKTPTDFTYYDGTTQIGGVTQARGLLKDMYTPKPGAPGAQVTTTYAYTALGNVAYVQMPPPNDIVPYTPATYQYNYTSDTINGVTTTKTEALGEPLSITDPLLQVTHFRYDERGNIAAVIDALLNETDYQYNLADQVTEIIYPATGQTGMQRAHTDITYVYPGGPVYNVNVYDEGNNANPVHTLGKVVGPEDDFRYATGNALQVAHAYDGLYRTKSLTDGNLHSTGYNFDLVGNLVKSVFPGNTGGVTDSVQAAYDIAHNLTSLTNGNNQTINYTVANASTDDSRLTDITYPPGTLPNVHYLYDYWGRVSDVYDGDQPLPSFATYHLHYDYDDLDNIIDTITEYSGLQTQANEIDYTYYPSGQRASMHIPLGTFTYYYNPTGTLKEVDCPWTGGTLLYTYDAANRLKTRQQYRATDTYSYNARNLRTDITTVSNLPDPNNSSVPWLISEFGNLTYDALGNLTQMSTAYPRFNGFFDPSTLDGTVTFGYDSLDRLIHETSSYPRVDPNGLFAGALYNFTHSADAADNLTILRNNAFTPNADNQIQGVGYDGEGNTLSLLGLTLGYDVEDRLTSYHDPTHGLTFSMGYRADGLRAWKQVNTDLPTYYFYDGDRVLYEMAAPSGQSGAITRIYAYGAAGLEQSYYEAHWSGTTYYPDQYTIGYTYDPLGNVSSRHYQNSSLPLDDVALYDAFGQCNGDWIPVSGNYYDYSNEPVGYGGQWGYYTDLNADVFGVSGLLHLGARDYVPGIGRFLTRDPIGYEGGINLYAFTGNNPVTHADPSGANWLTDQLSAAGAWIGDKVQAVGNGLFDLIKAPFQVKMDYKKQPSLQMAYRDPALVDITGEEVFNRVPRAGKHVTNYLDATGPLILGAAITGGAGTAGAYSFKLLEQEGDIAIIEGAGPQGTIEVMGKMELQGDTLFLRGAHIQGPGPGTIGIRGLGEYAQQFGRQIGVRRIVVEGARRSTGLRIGQVPRPFIYEIK